MRRLLRFMNYAAQLLALIDIGKTEQRASGRHRATTTTKNKKRNRLIYQRLRIFLVFSTSRKSQHCMAVISIATT